MASFSQSWRAVIELGLAQVGLYATYRLGVASGLVRWMTGSSKPITIDPGIFIKNLSDWPIASNQPELEPWASRTALLAEAEEIVSGKVRFFSNGFSLLVLAPARPLAHWTTYSENSLPANTGEAHDIKFTWEPARFSWAFVLVRAYCATRDERFAETFWRYFEAFVTANPPYLGIHWASGQEAAMRLLAFAFTGKLLIASPHSTPERMHLLAQAMADHARRLPPTLLYARSQNNNHLLSEAAGLYTAGLLLKGEPAAERWRRLGWKWFNSGIRQQFDQDGAYSQHSANYHRLALHLALWFKLCSRQDLPAATSQRLAAGTRWLLNLIDPASGHVPNLGPNDGTHLLPLCDCDYADFRPVIQAAGLAFLGAAPFPAGPWDELAAWLGISPSKASTVPSISPDLDANSPPVMRLANSHSWAYLRAARFHGRPGHADQLHLDLWWQGLNIAQDAGTYRYNDPPPWDNTLTSTAVHNTLTINDRDQMQRAGRFLYTHHAQARVIDSQAGEDVAWLRLVARHDGYRSQGVIHQRAVTARTGDHWVVVDTILVSNLRLARQFAPFSIRLHWLLPDYPWEISGSLLKLASPAGPVELSLEAQDGAQPGSRRLSLVRAGELLHGPGPAAPTWGWTSPTYGVLQPALAVIFRVAGWPPINLVSEWSFPDSNHEEKHNGG